MYHTGCVKDGENNCPTTIREMVGLSEVGTEKA